MGNNEREATKKTIYDLLNECTVRIPLPGNGSGYGTGFFVASGLILTCAHVVKTDQLAPTSVTIYWKGQTYLASIKTYLPDLSPNNPGPDLALLQVDIKKHPCVYLGETAEPGNELYTYGYTDENPDGAATTFELEGQVGDKNPALKFKAGQVRPGSSGAPLLNMHTHYVCGLIRFTRARDKDLGGIAISTRTVLQFMPELQSLQQKFHRRNRQWERYAKGLLFAYVSRRTFIAGLTIIAGSAGLAGWELTRPPSAQTPSTRRYYNTLLTYTKHTASVWTVAWSPDGRFIASADPGTDINNGPTIRIWEALTGVDQLFLRSQFKPTDQVTWSPDGTHIATGSRDGTVDIWNVLTKDAKAIIYGQQVQNDYVVAVAWSPNGTRIASGHFDRTVKVWDTGGHLLLTYTRHEASLRCLAWSRDSKYIASGSDDHTVQIWDAQTRMQICTYTGHIDAIQSVAWSPDNTSIASASSDKTVHVWYPWPPSGQLIHKYAGHLGIVTGVAWSPDNRRIVSVSWDRQAHVWDAKNGDHVYVYGAHTDKLRSVSWATQTGYIATAGDDKTVRVWQDKRP